MADPPRTGIDLLTHQLWRPVLDAGLARLAVGAAGVVGPWRDEEVYWAVPSPARLRLLVPAETPAVTSASLRNYRALRLGRERPARALLGQWARAGGPPGRGRVRLQIRTDAEDEARAGLPLAVVASALGKRRLYASIGVRPGANGKPTLQLIGADGRPAGYAKLGWNRHTDEYVGTETAALAALGGGAAGVGAPALLASGTLHGHPWLVSAPLPSEVRALDPRSPVVSAAELSAICPVVRTAEPAATAHWRRLTSRAAGSLAPEPLRTACRRLVSAIGAVHTPVPVARRWHGDLTPWNCARDGTGRLWCWDWENTEEDVVAGLDAIHWAFSVRRRSLATSRITLNDCLADAAPTLGGLGVPAAAHRLLAAIYAAVVADRALELVAVTGWERSWIGADEVGAVVAQGLDQLDQRN